MGDVKQSPEDGFREALKDLSAILIPLAGICPSTADLAGMVNLALENDGQLRLLMKLVTGQKR